MSLTQGLDRLFIGGEWRVPHSNRVIRSIDPSTEDVWAEAPEADEQDVDAAVEAACAAMSGSWTRTLTASQRGGLMLRLAELMRRDARSLAELESRDNGKPLRDTLGEIMRAADWMTYFGGAADKIQGDQIPYRPDALAYRPVHWMLPYGGYKMSQIGRENGLAALEEYTETKTVVVDLSDGMPADPFAD